MILGIGVDIVEIARIASLRARRGERFLRMVYTPAEIEYCLARKNADQHLAARFAAKEAAMKALGTGWAEGVTLKSVETLRADDGPPRLCLHAEAEERAARMGVRSTHLSLSHSDTAAVAVAVLEGDPPPVIGDPQRA